MGLARDAAAVSVDAFIEAAASVWAASGAAGFEAGGGDGEELRGCEGYGCCEEEKCGAHGWVMGIKGS